MTTRATHVGDSADSLFDAVVQKLFTTSLKSDASRGDPVWVQEEAEY